MFHQYPERTTSENSIATKMDNISYNILCKNALSSEIYEKLLCTSYHFPKILSPTKCSFLGEQKMLNFDRIYNSQDF